MKNIYLKMMIAAAAMSMVFSITACGSSGGVTETKQVDSLEELTIEALNEVDQQLSEAFEDVFGIMTNDVSWVTGGNDILSQIEGMQEGIIEGLNGGEDFDVSGTWLNDGGYTLTVVEKGEGLYDWEITRVEGDVRKTWSFTGEWDKAMGGMSYEGCVYREAPAAGEAGTDAEPVSADGKGHISYYQGELIWKIVVDGQEDGESVMFHR